MASCKTNIPQLHRKSNKVEIPSINENMVLDEPSEFENTSNKLKKKLSRSKLHRLSLHRIKSYRSDLKGSTCLAPNMTSQGIINKNACHQDKSRISNQLFQNNTKDQNVQEYSYPKIKLNTKNYSASSTSASNNSQKYKLNSIFYSSTSNYTSLGLKKCLSVSTLEESLELINNPKMSPMRKISKKVSFNNLQIREYELKLGDHPMCKSGPPITLGWNYSQIQEVSLDSPSSLVDDYCTSKIKRSKMSIDANTRYKMLRSVGYSDAEIMQAIRIRCQKRQLKSNECDATLLRSVVYPNFETFTYVKEGKVSRNLTYENNICMAHVGKNTKYYQFKNASPLRHPLVAARVA